MNSFPPHRTEPTGAASPLLRQKQIESASAASSRGRDPERDGGVEETRPVHVELEPVAAGDRGHGPQVVRRERGPAAEVVGVLERDQARAREVDVVGADGRLDLLERDGPVGPVRERARVDRAHGRRRPPARSRRCGRGGPGSSRRPRPQWQSWLTRFAIVPLGTKSAASLPRRSAAISSRRLTVGSSPKTSSPTSAAAMALRMDGVGRVIVSDRSSTSCMRTLLRSWCLVFGVLCLVFRVWDPSYASTPGACSRHWRNWDAPVIPDNVRACKRRPTALDRQTARVFL